MADDRSSIDDTEGSVIPFGPSADKAAWRAWARRERAGLDWGFLSEAVRAALRTFPPLRHNATVLTYLPMDQEIDLEPMLEGGLPVHWVVSRTPDEGLLTIHEITLPLEYNRLGFRQPRESAPYVDPHNVDIVLVPGLAFDLYGTRLGRGLGYYDELLGRMRAGTVFVGVTPAALVADRLPSDDHDIPVHWLASDEGVVGVAKSAG